MNNQTQPIVLITGVSSGIGRALAIEFKSHGYIVIGVCRHSPNLDLDLWIEADITNIDDQEKIIHSIESHYGTLDFLINNAGQGAYATWEELSETELRKLFELNFFAPIKLTLRVLPFLKKSKGTIVNISSTAGRLWVPCMGGYCATKAALAMFSNSLRPELKKSGIHVIDVAPGQINTGFSKRSLGTRHPPDAPGAQKGAEGIAHSIYKLCKKRKNSSVTYPRWQGFAIALIRGFIPRIYDKISQKVWKL